MIEEAVNVANKTGWDWSAIGQGLAAIGGIGSVVWAWVISQKKKLAETRADVAESKSEATVADANRLVYETLVARLTALEADIVKVRDELSAEREHSRMLERKLAQLDSWVRSQNLTPPLFT